jgi:FAD synthetase
MTTVVAQGTFDIVHPGHVHYLEEATGMGDELYVIVARAENVTHKQSPILPDSQRRAVVGSLEAVDGAVLGHREDFLVPIRELDPDVIVLGFDQHHDERALERTFAANGIDCRVERASASRVETETEIHSSSGIVDRVLRERERERRRVVTDGLSRDRLVL